MSNSRSNENRPGADPNLRSNSSSLIENLKENFAASLELKDNFPVSLELSDPGTINSFAEASDEEKEKAALCNICNGSQSTMDCPCHFCVPKDAVGCSVPIIHSDHMTDSCPDKKNQNVDDMNVDDMNVDNPQFSDDSSQFSDDGIPLSQEERLADIKAYLNAKRECVICGGNHSYSCCSYQLSVPLNSDVGPTFEVVCGFCGSRIGKNLFCSSCERIVIGCAIQKYCFICEEYDHTNVECPNASNPDMCPSSPAWARESYSDQPSTSHQSAAN